MENGNWDEANEQKVRLEEKQRAARRARDAEAEEAAKRGRVIGKDFIFARNFREKFCVLC